MTLFDLDKEAPVVHVVEEEEEDERPAWVMPLRDPEGALRQQLQAWGRRRRSPFVANPSLAREALETAGKLFLEHGMRARWALCSPTMDEAMTPKLRARVDRILRAAGLEAVFDEELFPTVHVGASAPR